MKKKLRQQRGQGWMEYALVLTLLIVLGMAIATLISGQPIGLDRKITVSHTCMQVRDDPIITRCYDGYVTYEEMRAYEATKGN